MRSRSASDGRGHGKTMSSWISPRKSDFEKEEAPSTGGRESCVVVAVSAPVVKLLSVPTRGASYAPGPSDLRDRRELAGARPDVRGRGAHQAPLALLLEDVRRPSADARAREHRGEHVRRDLGHVEHDGRPELDVRGEHAVGTAGLELGERRPLELLGGLEPRRLELPGSAAQDTGARVLGAVDALAEAHEALAAVERIAHPPIGVARPLDLVEHLEDA